MDTFCDHFEGADLDTEVWVPHYLPHWSSRAASAASYTVTGSELRLTIPPEHGLWCPDEHEPLKVSGIQSGVFSGPVGSRIGQQPFSDGVRVKEFQPTHWGWTPHYERLEVRARMEISPRSMGAVWMSGLEDEPERGGEICIFEVFGDAPTAVGVGLKQLQDPALTHDFQAPELPIDVSEFHVYAVDWRPGRVEFLVDGEHVRTVEDAPDYPMQMMVAVFDFPEKGPDTGHVPELAVDFVRAL
jgi:Glycosyl hydrolases family 16